MINPMIRHFAFLTLLQEGVYVAEKSPDHQSVSLRMSFRKVRATSNWSRVACAAPVNTHRPDTHAVERAFQRFTTHTRFETIETHENE
jgi:hypothetical protein